MDLNVENPARSLFIDANKLDMLYFSGVGGQI